MLWAQGWQRALGRWEEMPWWLHYPLGVVLGPPVAALWLFCFCPWGWLAAGLAVVGTYAALLWAGVFTWEEMLDLLGRMGRALVIFYCVLALPGLFAPLHEALDRPRRREQGEGEA